MGHNLGSLALDYVTHTGYPWSLSFNKEAQVVMHTGAVRLWAFQPNLGEKKKSLLSLKNTKIISYDY